MLSQKWTIIHSSVILWWCLGIYSHISPMLVILTPPILSQMNNYSFFCHSVVVYRYIQPYITQGGNSHTSCDVSDMNNYTFFCHSVMVYMCIYSHISPRLVILTPPVMYRMNNYTFFCHSVMVYRYIQPYITQACNSHTSYVVSDEQFYILLSFCGGV